MKIWYEIYGQGQDNEPVLLAKVKSQGLANIVAMKLQEIYTNVTVK